MALVSASRVSEHHALDLHFWYHRPNGVLFKLATLTKKWQPGAALKECLFPWGWQVLCTSLLWGSDTTVPENKPAPLFLSYVKPHNPITAQRMGHWIKDLMKEAGVNIDVFKAHFVRGGSTLAALRKGVQLSDILNAADWSRESTSRVLDKSS